MNKLNFLTKQTGDSLEAQEWNQVVNKIDELVESNNSSTGGSASTVIDSSGVISTSGKGNVTLGSTKNINLEPVWSNNVSNYYGNWGDIALKPGDDILFCSHHREPKKRDKIVVKNIDGSDNPVKLQIVAGELDLAVGTENNPKTATKKKDSTTGADTSATLFKSEDSKTLDVRILTGNTLDKNTDNEREERGYLKVRAQAIDLRCEKHGGIALLPKGYDSDGNMNKIKFEHGGGDGLEFGTFNTEKSSLYTDEYRFKRDGIWKMATRQTTPNAKTVYDDNTPAGKSSTASVKYVKQADDFYDIIDLNDEQCTTKDIIKTAFSLNGHKSRHTKVTNSGAIEIATLETYVVSIEETPADLSGVVDINTISTEIGGIGTVAVGDVFNEKDFEQIPTVGTIYTNGTQYFSFIIVPAPNIKLDSGSELKLGGILDFGSSFNFGETDNGIQTLLKLTKKNKTKDCGVLKVIAINNHATESMTTKKSLIDYSDPSNPVLDDSLITISPGNSETIAEASLFDIIQLTNYMKANHLGPWTPQL